VEFTQATDWETLLEKGSGRVDIFYYPTEPFIYKNEIGELEGIEKEILESFFRFVEKKYEVKIFRNWIEVSEFDSLFRDVATHENAFGISLISKTKRREEIVAFSSAYMPDVSVLISNISVPFINDTSEVRRLEGFEAATISNTTYQDDLMDLSEKFALDLKLINVASEENIIELVSINSSMVGYVGLPFYVIEIGKGNPVKRQGTFQVKRDGYRFIYNKSSGWKEPVQKYFESYLYKAEADHIIRRYLGNDYSELIWGIAGSQQAQTNDTEIEFLNREKELQSRSLFQSQQEKEMQQLIIIATSIGLLFVVIIVFLLVNNNRRKSKINLMLMEKQDELELLLKQLNQQKDEIGYQRKLLQQKNKQLVNINRQKDDLIGLVAHDLKSPINQMTGLINLLGFKSDSWDNEEKQLYEKLEQSNSHLKELVERILDLEAIKEDSLNYHITKVDMIALMKEVIDDFEGIAKRKEIKIKGKDLDGHYFVMADAFFLKQVFENLLSNAIKFSPHGKTVEIIAEEVDEFYHIIIKDEGPGISKKDKGKLFTKYQTLSAKPTGDESSTGLGLSIVKKYVEEMEGSVWVESKEGQGAEFYVSFKQAK